MILMMMMMMMMNSLKSDWKCQEWVEELENMKEHEVKSPLFIWCFDNIDSFKAALH